MITRASRLYPENWGNFLGKFRLSEALHKICSVTCGGRFYVGLCKVKVRRSPIQGLFRRSELDVWPERDCT